MLNSLLLKHFSKTRTPTEQVIFSLKGGSDPENILSQLKEFPGLMYEGQNKRGKMKKEILVVMLLAGMMAAQEAAKPKVISLEVANQILKAEHDLDQANLTKASAEAAFQDLKASWQAADVKAVAAKKAVDAALAAGQKECGDGFNLDPANFTCTAKPKAEVAKPAEAKKP